MVPRNLTARLTSWRVKLLSRLLRRTLVSLLCLWQLPGALADVSVDDVKIIELARETIAKVRYATLATVDDAGQPRTRIVDPFPPDDEFVIYVATNPATRKVGQITAHDQVTLFYFDSDGRNYVSVMGTATLVNDVVFKTKMRREADSDRIYPNFPDDYLLIRIEPDWIEGLLPGYRGDRQTWMPARVNLSAQGSLAK